VATPEVDRFSDLVRVAVGRHGFLEAIESALSEGDVELRHKRMAAVRTMSWEHRAQVSLQTAMDALRRREQRTGPQTARSR
jgi:hypothetical protein